jgi:hypothetical protein
MKKILSASLIVITFFSVSCKEQSYKNSTKKVEVNTDIIQAEIDPESKTNSEQKSLSFEFAKQSVNDKLAIEIKNYITTKLLTIEDLKLISEDQRKFQIYQIDLNNDGENEIFVNFITSYFCGSGGCTILLLNNQLKPITKFTVTRTPLFAEQILKNGWRILLTKSEGELKELVYTDGTYPSNPSLIEKAPYDAPSGHSEIMFDINFSNPKTYNF